MNAPGGDRTELLYELGLSEEEELLLLEKESFEAQYWLERRKDQEHRDESLARAIQDSLLESDFPPQSPAPPPPAQSTVNREPAPSIRTSSPPALYIPQLSMRGLSSNTSHRPRNNTARTAADIQQDLIDLTGSGPAISGNRAIPLGFAPAPARGSQLPQQFPSPMYDFSDPHSLPSLPPGHAGLEAYRQYASMPGNFPAPAANFNPYYQLNSIKGQEPPLPWNASAIHPPGNIIQDYDGPSNPAEMKKELESLLENIRPDEDLKCNGQSTPEAMKFKLMEHQKYGLAWMKAMEEGSNHGGILADDMGLGKTIQALALIVSRPSPDPELKTTLVVAPVSLMHQWKREIEQKLKQGRHQLSVYILHGDKRGTSFSKLKRCDVVLTSFGTLASEFKRKEELEKYFKENPARRDDHSLYAQMPILGILSKWYRVIVDEAQCIKNKNTKAARACYAIRSTYRWCMSGTPMMNNVTELYSLLRFLRIGPYNMAETFDATFTRPLKSTEKEQELAMRKLQALLKAILLRRTKSSKINGRPILQLPPRTTEKVHAVFSEDEQLVYSGLEAKTQIQFNRYLDAGTVGAHYSSVLVMLLRLRQACCHPHLIQFFNDDNNVNLSNVDLKANAKLLSPGVVARLRENGNSECPVCIDAVENPIIFFPCGHSTCAECFAKISDPSRGVAEGTDGAFEVKCPNCRAKVDPKKVTDSLSFRKVHFPGDDDSNEIDARSNCQEGDSEDDDSDSDGLDDFIVDDENEDEDADRSGSKKRKRKAKVGNKKNLATLKKESQKNAKAKKRYLRRLEKRWETSAKIEKTLEILRETETRGEGEKTIIFSQFTTLLDLLEVPIMKEGWKYRRYDGSMSPIQRNEAVLEFTDSQDCKIMLVSLKAGNAGLNLVAASQVIIFDPFWNPYIEEQAIDRAHRIGQTRPVIVHRILVENTVEDRILELQEQKRELIENALDEKASKSLGRLGTRELAFLFGLASRR
ncbi:rad8 protein [Uncinocarpus reesii 1704]|uniref:Rad8 protein n=1 Tax=Uncinocarpus reesii (strain UAMH 1704) TaxID=336963 RepID=C4JR04_UNCRE|nr:rad8 protein [Uncinocarpus reesii 1704]EEP78640.1 rad8 protein [Uncinocarpus reesii 1704]